MIEFENLEYDRQQFDKIYEAMEKGINIIPMLNKNLSVIQMNEIQFGLEHGLTIEQVNIYAKPQYDAFRMREIRLGLEHGLTIEQVNVFANLDPSYYDIVREVRLGLEHGLNLNQINTYIGAWAAFDVREVRLGLENGISLEQAKMLANSILRRYLSDRFCVERICQAFECGITTEQVEKILKKHTTLIGVGEYGKYDVDQLNEIFLGLENGLTMEQVGVYASSTINAAVMNNMRKAIESGLSIKVIEILAKKHKKFEITLDDVKTIKLALEEYSQPSEIEKLENSEKIVNYIKYFKQSKIKNTYR